MTSGFSVVDQPSSAALTAKHWRVETVLRLFTTILLGFSLGGLLLGAIALTLKNSGKAVPPELNLVLGSLALHGTALPALVWFVRVNGLTLRDAFGLESDRVARGVLLGVGLGLSALPIIYGFQWISVRILEMAGIDVDLQSNVKLLLEGTATVRWFLAIIAVIVAPLVEEGFFRGVLFSFLRDLGQRKLAYAVTSVLFGLSHFNAAAFLPLTVFGAMLAWSYERSGSLVVPLTAHAVFNTAPFVMVLIGINLDAGVK